MRALIKYFSLLSGLIVLDQSLKELFVRNGKYIVNKGMFLNIFEDMPSHIKIIFLGTYSSFLFLVFIILVTSLSKEAKKLKIFLSFLTAGICSNSIDKIIKGYTIDFIPFIDTSFNTADIYIFVGVIFINVILFFSKESFISKQDMRKFNLIEPKAQVKYARKVSFFVFASALILGTLSYTFLITYISPVILNSKSITSTFLALYILISLILVIMSFPFGLYLSSKVFGPLHGLHLYVEDLRVGKLRKFQTRKGDELQKVNTIASNIEKIINKK